LHFKLACLLALFIFISNPLPICARQSDELQLKAVVAELSAAYTEKDLARFTQLWSRASPDLAGRKRAVEALFATNEKIEAKVVEIGRVKIEPGKASLRATLEVSGVEAGTGRPSTGLGKLTRAIYFVREGEAWKLWKDVAAEEELAARLVAAKNDDERASLMSEEKELITSELARALERLGENFRFRSDNSRAMEVFRLAIKIAEQIGDKRRVSSVLMSIGHVHSSEGDDGLALDSFKRGLAMAEQAGYKRDIAISLGETGELYTTFNNFSLALQYLQRAMQLGEEIDDKPIMAGVLDRIGQVYAAQGNYDLALNYHQKALAMNEEARFSLGISGALDNIGNAYLALGNYDEAQKYFEKNLALVERLGHKTGISPILQEIGLAHSSRGDYKAALDYNRKSLDLAESLGQKRQAMFALTSIARTYLAEGNYSSALEYSQRAAAAAREAGILGTLRLSSYMTGRAYFGLNKLAEARTAFDEAINIGEQLRLQVTGGEQQRQVYFERVVPVYYAMVELLVAQGQLSEALTYAERAKGRVLLDVLHSGRINVTKAMTAKEQEQERALARDLAMANAQAARAGSDSSRRAETEARLKKARLDYEAFQTALYVAHPDLKLQRGQAPLFGPKQARDLMTDEKTALLEYVVTENKTYLFALTGGRGDGPDLKVYPISVSRKELADRAEQLRQRLANRDRDYQGLARDMFALLVKPAASQLSGKTGLVIVPDDILWNLPFQALQPTAGRYLIEEFALSYMPSLAVLGEMARRRVKRGPVASELLAVGNPVLGKQTIDRTNLMRVGIEPLPEAERQVNALGRLYGPSRSKVYTGGAAREDVVKAEAKNYSVIHLATHGVLNDASPMYSHVLLATAEGRNDEDGLLEAWEIMNLDLKADMVVLSACETARGRIGAGEGVIGLMWALFVAGSPTTVVSQWKVESTSTTELMLDFYKHLKSAQAVSKAEALRRASLKLLRSKQYAHPFYWAGFEVVGDPH
jgi:CHAT domain-containing protein/tetratricopeptide (TPR) repeat protein